MIVKGDELNRGTPLDPAVFRSTAARWATGIAVATVRSENGIPYGLTVNSFTSVSLHPPLVLVCVDYRCTFISTFRTATHFAVNVLGQNQKHLSVRFAQKEVDRFEQLDWSEGAGGAPVIAGCIANFECAVHSATEAGDHTVFIGEVLFASSRDGQPLLYFGSAYRELVPL